MGDLIPIIVTGAGAPGILGTIYSLRNNPDNVKFKICSVDIKEDSIGKYFSDEFYVVPNPENDDYIDKIIKLSKKINSSLILPQTTREIMTLSKFKEDLKKLGINVIVSDYEKIIIANDKYLLLEKTKEINIPFPKYYLIRSKDEFMKIINLLGFPKKKVVVKPRISNGMRGLRIITNDYLNIKKYLEEKPEGVEIDIDSFLKIFNNDKWPDLIVTEYLPGDEYTVDVFRNKKNIIVIPRLRKVIRSGITFEAKVEFREDLIDYSKKLSNEIDLNYCFGFQFKLDEDKIPKILECNPRVQGSMVISTFAGFNMIYYAVKCSLMHDISLDNIKLKEITFKRYWGGVAIDNENFIDKI